MLGTTIGILFFWMILSAVTFVIFSMNHFDPVVKDKQTPLAHVKISAAIFVVTGTIFFALVGYTS